MRSSPMLTSMLIRSKPAVAYDRQSAIWLAMHVVAV
jgi:hypothetical protein